MELFLPSIFVLLAAAILMFGVFPNLPRFFLVLIAIGLLALTAYQHNILFQDEYTLSSWQNSVTNATVPLLIAVTVLFMVGFLLNFLGGGGGGGAAPGPKASATAPPVSKNFTTTQRKALESLIRNP